MQSLSKIVKILRLRLPGNVWRQPEDSYAHVAIQKKIVKKQTVDQKRPGIKHSQNIYKGTGIM